MTQRISGLDLAGESGDRPDADDPRIGRNGAAELDQSDVRAFAVNSMWFANCLGEGADVLVAAGPGIVDVDFAAPVAVTRRKHELLTGDVMGEKAHGAGLDWMPRSVISGKTDSGSDSPGDRDLIAGTGRRSSDQDERGSCADNGDGVLHAHPLLVNAW
ncbi:Uncharacterised protein [Mycobacteroides abscessus subsp. abscessus]|nr:Uncharacterised protein [Mycobacteroides abscessus subsp. abscessus]